MEYQAFEKASHRLIDSVWTVTFRKIGQYSVEVFAYNRQDEDGYKFEGLLPKVTMVENDERVLEYLEINGVRYIVENPKHIFSY